MKNIVAIMLVFISFSVHSFEWTESIRLRAVEGCVNGAVTKSLPINIEQYEKTINEKLDINSEYYKKMVNDIEAHYEPYCICVTKYSEEKYEFAVYESMTPEELSSFGKAAWKKCLN